MQIERNQVAGIYFSKHLLKIQDGCYFSGISLCFPRKRLFSFANHMFIEPFRLFSFPLKKLLQLLQKVLNLFTIALEGSRQVVVEGSRPGEALFPWLFPADQKAKSISVGVLDIRCPK